MALAADKKFSGQDGAITVDGVLCEVVQSFKYQGRRDPIQRPMIGKNAPRSWDGPYVPSLSMKINQSDFDFFTATMTDTPVSGTATTLVTTGDGIAPPGAATWGTPVVPDDTTPGTSSRVRFTTATAAVTGAGKCIVIGTDENDEDQEETIRIPVMAIGAYVTTTKTFKTVDQLIPYGWVQVGGKIAVASVAGSSTVTVTPHSKRMTLVARATRDDGVRGTLTITNCWPILNDFSMEGGGTSIMEPEIPFAIADPDTDINFVRDTV